MKPCQERMLGLVVVSALEAQYDDASRWDLARLAQPSDDEAFLAEQGLQEWAAALDAKDQSTPDEATGGRRYDDNAGSS